MKTKGYEFVLLAVFLWSFVPITIRLLLPYISAESMMFYRFLISVIVILPFALISKSIDLRSMSRQKLLTYFVLAVFYTGILYTYILAISYTKIANAQFLQQLAPIYTFLFAHFLLKERTKPNHYYALMLAVLGTFLILYFDTGFVFESSFIGNVLALVSGLFLAFYITLSRYIGKRYSEFEATLWAFIFGAIIMSFSAFNTVSLSIDNWLLLIVLGVFLTALPFLFLIKSSRHVKAQQTSILILLTTITIPILAFLFLNEAPSTGTIIGGLLILLSSLIVLKS